MLEIYSIVKNETSFVQCVTVKGYTELRIVFGDLKRGSRDQNDHRLWEAKDFGPSQYNKNRTSLLSIVAVKKAVKEFHFHMVVFLQRLGRLLTMK